MKKAYLLVYSDSLGTKDEVKAVLNELAEVVTWRTDIPHSFYVVSEADARTLANLIRQKCGAKGRFLLTEIGNNRQGWLTPESWYFINNKRVKPKA